MQIFSCPACGGTLYFENTRCACGQAVTFDPDSQQMITGAAPCANHKTIACNWPAEQDGLCRSCAMTRTVPDLATAENTELWATTEAAKRWMLANLARWGWFTRADPGPRPTFEMLSEQTRQGEAQVVMGHAEGLITINVTEASEATRAERRETLGELYRTMLGHMRHEMAHFLHKRLMQEGAFAAAFRQSFGDERADYAAALEQHYANPRPADDSHITSYATSHPHEDWAETTAHLLHLTDLLDSVAATGLALPEGPPAGYDAYAESDADHLLTLAIHISLALNHVNRAMDLPDVYPFILAPGVREKLGFVHHWLRRGDPARTDDQTPAGAAS
ncbi:zinc-binding metallopeptidase family protein [Roseibium aestuarii]|uniref:Zinc-binding metallopeptidase n=1 Tax=Roseibium aestuarii TaxID=2600299 RepID=A0ABW4JZS0_9HYPH|nr:putative zinc-binding metallopeptidase [Roseibium aestuarii]